jgi:hypothetical protein
VWQNKNGNDPICVALPKVVITSYILVVNEQEFLLSQTKTFANVNTVLNQF